jgi:hypothetical protein
MSHIYTRIEIYPLVENRKYGSKGRDKNVFRNEGKMRGIRNF